MFKSFSLTPFTVELLFFALVLTFSFQTGLIFICDEWPSLLNSNGNGFHTLGSSRRWHFFLTCPASTSPGCSHFTKWDKRNRTCRAVFAERCQSRLSSILKCYSVPLFAGWQSWQPSASLRPSWCGNSSTFSCAGGGSTAKLRPWRRNRLRPRADQRKTKVSNRCAATMPVRAPVAANARVLAAKSTARN